MSLEATIRDLVKKYSIELLIANSLLILALAVALIVVAVKDATGNTAVTTATSSSQQAKSSDDTATSVSHPTAKHLSLSGTGNKATDPFELEPGLVKFTFSYNGDSNFIVHLLDELGNDEGGIANEIGSTTGSNALQVTKSGKYILNVEAEGSWTIEIDQ